MLKSLSRIWLFVTPWTIPCQAPLSMELSRQEYWSGLPFPSPADLPDPGIKPVSPALQAASLLTKPAGKSYVDVQGLTLIWLWSTRNSQPPLPSRVTPTTPPTHSMDHLGGRKLQCSFGERLWVGSKAPSCVLGQERSKTPVDVPFKQKAVTGTQFPSWSLAPANTLLSVCACFLSFLIKYR